jgi:hypothetical protein
VSPLNRAFESRRVWHDACIYTYCWWRMSGFIQDNGENRFANGVGHCDLRVHSDAAERDSRNKAEEFPAPPIGKLLGMTITKIGNGQDSVELQADERHANPMGTIHGGVFCDIADAVMGLAYRSTLAESESLTTIELKINFLRPVKFLT